jgi:hypothetical protein
MSIKQARDAQKYEYELSRFRSISDLKGFNDSTKFTEPSLTDSSHYVPTDVLVGRCLRGENRSGFLGASGTFDYDTDSLDIDKVEQEFNPTRRPNFDLADATAILRQGEAAKKELEAAKSVRSRSKGFPAPVPSAGNPAEGVVPSGTGGGTPPIPAGGTPA